MDVTILKQQFTYKDGELYWAVSRKGVTKGAIASRINPTTGYRDTRLFRKVYQTHRLIFLLHHEYTPQYVDHIDGNPLNNRIENLRPCTKSQNACNQKLRSNSKSGVRGVSWISRNSKWVARVGIEGKQLYLGLFDTIEEATNAVEKARQKHYGEFARPS